MMSFDEVAARCAELSEPAVVESGLSIERLLTEIEDVLRRAKADGAHSACVSALGLVLRVHELIAAYPGAAPEFQGASDTAEVMQMLIEQAGGPRGAIELANELIEASQAQLADQAILVR